MSYQIFKRTWWRKNKEWPNGLEPCPGTRFNAAVVDTEEEARSFCKERNGRYKKHPLGLRYEYTERTS